LADHYSLGAIARAKAGQIHLLKPGERVLYVGVGSGEDAILAARAGSKITCVDVSEGMLTLLRGRLDREGRSAELICESLFDHVPDEPYDVVVANFFLNLYAAEGVERALAKLRSLLVIRGTLLIADFAPCRGGWPRRALQIGYYRLVNLVAWALGLCALHPIYDYARFLSIQEFELIERRRVAIAGAGSEFFEFLAARRLDVLPFTGDRPIT
jgi:ubiquinone/menaquinone biosynthesis C-methylase UbiE